MLELFGHVFLAEFALFIDFAAWESGNGMCMVIAAVCTLLATVDIFSYINE